MVVRQPSNEWHQEECDGHADDISTTQPRQAQAHAAKTAHSRRQQKREHRGEQKGNDVSKASRPQQEQPEHTEREAKCRANQPRRAPCLHTRVARESHEENAGQGHPQGCEREDSRAGMRDGNEQLAGQNDRHARKQYQRELFLLNCGQVNCSAPRIQRAEPAVPSLSDHRTPARDAVVAGTAGKPGELARLLEIQERKVPVLALMMFGAD